MSPSILDGVVFRDPALLEQALTHRSWTQEQGDPHNERLEFLGDAVLQLAASQLLFDSFADSSEGALSMLRQKLVCTGTVAELARAAGLGERARLGVGEASTGGREREKLLANLFEAVLGALYLDQGPDAAFAAARRVLRPLLPTLNVQNRKAVLQEWNQARNGNVPRYVELACSGPDHARVFHVGVYVDDALVGEGTGSSKRRAEMAAAEDAVARLGLV